MLRPTGRDDNGGPHVRKSGLGDNADPLAAMSDLDASNKQYRALSAQPCNVLNCTNASTSSAS